MIKCYAIKDENDTWCAPKNMRSTYKGIHAFNTLTDKEREKYGQYKCELYNECYDLNTHYRSNTLEYFFDEEKNTLIAFYKLYPRSLSDVISQKCNEVTELFKLKYYTNIKIKFPDNINRYIQFRNDFDKLNLFELSILAQSNININLRTEDNYINVLSPKQYMDIYTTVINKKQNLLNILQNHKDNLNKLTTIGDVLNYNIEENWI